MIDPLSSRNSYQILLSRTLSRIDACLNKEKISVHTLHTYARALFRAQRIDRALRLAVPPVLIVVNYDFEKKVLAPSAADSGAAGGDAS